jgi:GNAT superfamily N-acetyltransferase
LLSHLRTGKKVPGYINRLAGVGASISSILPESIQEALSPVLTPGQEHRASQQQQQARPASVAQSTRSNDSGSFFGSLSSLSSLSSSQPAQRQEQTQTFVPFTGGGNTLGSEIVSQTTSAPSAPNADDVRRRKMAEAAERRFGATSTGASEDRQKQAATWSVRGAKESDIPEMAKIQRESLKQTYGSFLTTEMLAPLLTEDAIEGHLHASLATMWVAVFGTTVCGFMGLDKDDLAKIDALWVSLEHRQKGVGRTLVKDAENRIRRNHAKASLECFSPNMLGLTFFAKMGYAISGHMVDTDTQVAKVLMSKDMS